MLLEDPLPRRLFMLKPCDPAVDRTNLESVDDEDDEEGDDIDRREMRYGSLKCSRSVMSGTRGAVSASWLKLPLGDNCK
jgi:hypothetical protein